MKRNAIRFIEELLNHQSVKDLELFDDLGVKVSIHTYDVLKVCTDEIGRDFKNLELASKRLDFFAIVIGVIIHDLSKGIIRRDGEDLSHSQMMIKNPDYIGKETEKILTEIEENIGLKIQKNILKNIIHIVVSHHGRWGRIQPGSREAHIVHKADEYSAKHHRVTPVGSDKILKLLSENISLEEIEKIFNCTSGIIKDRLKRTKQELGIKSTRHLISYYKKHKKVPLGDSFFETRLKETEKLIKLVNKKGFKNLVMENPLLEYLEDSKIFQLY